MRLLRDAFDALMGLALRMVFGMFLFGVAMVLLVALIETSIRRRQPP